MSNGETSTQVPHAQIHSLVVDMNVTPVFSMYRRRTGAMYSRRTGASAIRSKRTGASAIHRQKRDPVFSIYSRRTGASAIYSRSTGAYAVHINVTPVFTM